MYNIFVAQVMCTIKMRITMKNRMKKLITMSVVSVMALAMVTGCGKSSSSSSSSAADSTSSSAVSSSSSASSSSLETASVSKASKNYKIAMSHQHMTNAFQNSLMEGADEMAETLGVTVQHFDANQDVAQQIADLEQCISDGYDAILFEPVDPAGLKDVAQKIKDAGIICINDCSKIDDAENLIDGYAGASNVEAGELEMSKVCELIGGKGDIAILTGPDGDAGGLLRYEGYMNVLEKYPDVKVVVEAAADWDTTKAMETVESWGTNYDLAAIVCENDGMAVGAANALGGNKDVVITGVDASDDGLEAIANGLQAGTVSQDAVEQGRLAIRLAVDLLEKKVSGYKEYLVDMVWVNSENVNDFLK